MENRRTILVAPLHWGLGHTTRCIPIIKALIEFNFNVIIASDGAALMFLQKEFPNLKSIELPSYNISYPKNGAYFKWNFIKQIPQILKAISLEKNIVRNLVFEGQIDGILSDNRPGIINDKIPSVYITHQLRVLSGSTSYFTSKIHQRIIKKYSECWIPDLDNSENLSGKLSQVSALDINSKYIGILTRMKKIKLPKKYDILILLSGPEPQRSFLEKKLIRIFRYQKKSVLLIRGCVDPLQEITKLGAITCYNFMNSKELEKAINSSELIISRPGYTTLMDLGTIGKKAFFIPTPGQYEQVYLAKRMKQLMIAPFCNQDDFSIENLNEVSSFKGMYLNNAPVDYNNLFKLFRG